MRCGTIYTSSLDFCKGHPLINWLKTGGAAEDENQTLNILMISSGYCFCARLLDFKALIASEMFTWINSFFYSRAQKTNTELYKTALTDRCLYSKNNYHRVQKNGMAIHVRNVGEKKHWSLFHWLNVGELMLTIKQQNQDTIRWQSSSLGGTDSVVWARLLCGNL